MLPLQTLKKILYQREKFVITGTRYLNVEGMFPFENIVAHYIKATNNHILYRVTPILEGDNLIAYDVLYGNKLS